MIFKIHFLEEANADLSKLNKNDSKIILKKLNWLALNVKTAKHLPLSAKVGKVKIGKFAIVGTNTTILPDVIIGEGVAVAANSLITKDLEPWSIYVGNRKVGERNKEEVLKNYEKFLATSENERVGNLFK